jgi:hypothetical protein
MRFVIFPQPDRLATDQDQRLACFEDRKKAGIVYGILLTFAEEWTDS